MKRNQIPHSAIEKKFAVVMKSESFPKFKMVYVVNDTWEGGAVNKAYALAKKDCRKYVEQNFSKEWQKFQHFLYCQSLTYKGFADVRKIRNLRVRKFTD
jgi:hypothetical protein